jgi:hypothetical protein
VDNFKLGLGEIGWSDVYWIGLTQNREQKMAVLSAVMNPCVPYKCWEVHECLSNRWLLE